MSALAWQRPTFEVLDQLPEVSLATVLAKTIHGPVLARKEWPDIYPRSEVRHTEHRLDPPKDPMPKRPPVLDPVDRAVWELGPAPSGYRPRWPLPWDELLDVDRHPVRLNPRPTEREVILTAGDVMRWAGILISTDRLPRGDHPRELGHADDGTPIVRAYPVKVDGYPDARLCRGRVYMRLRDTVHEGGVIRRELVRCDEDDRGAQLYTCGAPLDGKRPQAKYCDKCVGNRQKVAATRRRRLREDADEVLSTEVELIADYVKRIGEHALDLDVIRAELAAVPERQRAAILDQVGGDLDAREVDVLSHHLAELPGERVQRDEYSGEEDGYGDPEPNACLDRAADVDLAPVLDLDAIWCHLNHAAGVLPGGSLGRVRPPSPAPKSGRSGRPRLRASGRDGVPQTREEVWRVQDPRILPRDQTGAVYVPVSTPH